MAGPKYELPDEFLEAADRFVSVANALGEKASRDWVRAVMMYATARYNAFTWVTREGDPAQTIDEAAAYFRSEYETMFRENVKEVAPVYRVARKEKPQ